MSRVELVDLAAQRRRVGERIDAAVARVMAHGRFVMGPEVASFEAGLAELCRVRHVVSCASGTDALLLLLLAHRVGPGDAVVVPAFTFAATAEPVALLGATPVFADVLPDTFDLDPASARAAVAAARELGLRPRAVIAVDLFGQPAGYDALAPLAADLGLVLLADAAQSVGATWQGRPVGTLATATATSFFPAKPLGSYGDGGAVLTDDGALADEVRSLRLHGRGADKYDNVRIGLNSRLDTLQAAVLLEKLAVFPAELAARAEVAARYAEALGGLAGVTVPRLRPGATSTWAAYTVQTPGRDALAAALDAAGIASAVFYPRPLHEQPAYRGFPAAPGGLPVATALAGCVLSLPMHPYLDEGSQRRVCRAVVGAVAAGVPEVGSRA